ncbi:MAG: hypothetical protein LBE18_04370 [Planctomycetaceae bacterium]|nr:hypothetical protein [Planctomycetaceae bacterium]
MNSFCDIEIHNTNDITNDTMCMLLTNFKKIIDPKNTSNEFYRTFKKRIQSVKNGYNP